MTLFDVKKYEVPDPKNVNMDQTRYNVGVFLSAYLSARARCNQPREPKVTSSFSLVPPSAGSGGNNAEAERLLIENEEAAEELTYLHKLFTMGYSAIQHPFKPDICERRKRVFYDRYIKGDAVYICAQRLNVSEDLVSQDASLAIIQFADALDLVEFR
ncbi:ArpU family transcriptional regulator [Enterococcus larvae]|uniref:ArpU family transcriptional regulator n=1 Tax=Enterococcus larvae TaxID=2794352 RepID=UPI003F39A17F